MTSLANEKQLSTRGSHVVDAYGDEYLDCGGYGVPLLGHAHHAVVEAVVEQIRRPALMDRLMLDLATPSGLDHVHVFHSAAEAGELAVTLARANGRPRVVSAADVPFGDVETLRAELAGGPPACVLLEPVRGVLTPPAGYLTAVVKACHDFGALLMVDETRTALGRLGTWWGVDIEGVSPDILLIGDSLSAGVLPVAAVVATASVDVPILRGSRFSPISVAAINTTLRVTAAEGLVERASALGDELLLGLRRCLAGRAYAGGRGLLIGIEFPDEDAASVFVGKLLRARVLVHTSGRVVRLTPPAVLTPADVNWLLDAAGVAARGL